MGFAYDKSPARLASVNRYRKTVKGKVTKARYSASVKGLAAHARYLASPKGKAARALVHARRRARSTNPEDFAARVQQMWERCEPCAYCGVTAEQIDHILPLAAGGTDDWLNLQPLCKTCHKLKTAADITAIRSA